MSSKRVRIEHAGAKNGGGYSGRRAAAKKISRKLRRRQDRDEVRRQPR